MKEFKNSLDYIERKKHLNPEKSPFGKQIAVDLLPDRDFPRPASETISLDGIWEMSLSGDGINAEFSDAVPAKIPGSVHCALIASGKMTDENGNIISDPYYARSDKYARAASIRDYTFRKRFTVPDNMASEKLLLTFEGVCEHCSVWLNGIYLGDHRGMFGGPEFDVTGIVRSGENTLILLLHGAPDRPRNPGEMPTFFGGGNPWLNLGWIDTATFNCTYGWHYADIPGLGIWRSVSLRKVSGAELDSPFITTLSTDGDMLLSCDIITDNKAELTVCARISPYNFEGQAYSFVYSHEADAGKNNLTFAFTIPEPHLWNLNGVGKANLYTLELTLLSDGVPTDTFSTRFGIRTIEMRPIADPTGKTEGNPSQYNWIFVINNEPTFMKGTGWCTLDALMRFTPDRYRQFISAAKNQNVNILRAWGGGLVETDEFYDLCDESGIAVFQEWPTAWDSYVCQPENVLLETVRYGVKRLKNRPSLILWCGGNEGAAPLESNDPNFDPAALNLMGKTTLELDGTRPWHRQEPFGGSIHDYISSWGGQHPSKSMTLCAPFIGEFGVDCWPSYESVKKYVPAEELKQIDDMLQSKKTIPDDSSLAHHTPLFNKAGDVARLQQHVELFLPATSVRNCILGSQLAQVVGVRHTLERARSRFPLSTGAIMYKLNDPFPGASWSTVDWYGAEKPAAFFVGDAFAPLTAILIADKLNYYGENAQFPIFVLNDRLEDCILVRIRVINSSGKTIREMCVDITGDPQKIMEIAVLSLSPEETATAPMLIVLDADLRSGGHARNWYFFNFENSPGALFSLPRTTVECSIISDHAVTVKNIGSEPAVCVSLCAPGLNNLLRASDGCILLFPGESQTIECNFTDGISGASGWNC